MRIAVLVGLSCLAAPTQVCAARRVDYARDVKPILVEKCYACHGSWKQKGKLRLDTAPLIRAGGRNGPAVVPRKPAESPLLERIASDDAEIRMPPPGDGERLTAEQRSLLKRWIEEGAEGPEEPPPPGPREHWAFQPVKRPPVPEIRIPQFEIRNPVDAFLAAEWRKHGLTPAPEADRATLLRRVYFDLIGLPPTPEELWAFLKDTSPDAYEKVVEKLLASPRYGERWGRHWMDVWRYSDWSGENNNQVRSPPKHVWRWRDWIVESLNADKGYDRMILEMLAADEIAPGDAKVLRATGFLARNYYRYNRNVWLDDAVEHTAKAFLGLTVSCCRCHDHKFDPIASADYYRLRAIFEPHQVRTDPVPGQRDTAKDGLVRVFDRDLETPTYIFRRGDEAQPDRGHPLTAGVPEILGGKFEPKPVRVALSPSAAGVVLGSSAATLPPEYSSGRRLAFARWLTHAGNPLTARVAVNHIWLRHFGEPLVSDVTDFGLRAAKPRHAALLDWLAAELVCPSPPTAVGGLSRAWSMKHLHRLLVTSSAYRMASGSRTPQADPENRYLWRMNPRRLEAEAIRDAVLRVAGNLDLKMGGPEIPLTEAETSPRRSIYFRHAHERQVPFLALLDSPNPLECYRRPVTVVPQQALAVLNGPLVLDQSRLLAGKLAKETDEGFVVAAFERVLCRQPSDAEADRCRKFLAEQTALLANPEKLTPADGGPMSRVPPSTDPRQRARENLLHVLLNHNDFVTVW